jgi:hypothetical protein
MLRDDPAEVIGAAGVPALLDHLEQAAGAQPGIRRELLEHERQIRIDQRRARSDLLRLDTGLVQHALDGRVMDVELLGDRF